MAIFKECSICQKYSKTGCTTDVSCRRRNGSTVKSFNASDPPSQFKLAASVTCPHAETCAKAQQFLICFEEFEDDEPCPAYWDKSKPLPYIKLDLYPVGAKLKVRDDLTNGTKYGTNTAVEQMVEKAGTIVTVTINYPGTDTVRIKEDDWGWTVDMFDGMLPLESEDDNHESGRQTYPETDHTIDAMVYQTTGTARYTTSADFTF